MSDDPGPDAGADPGHTERPVKPTLVRWKILGLLFLASFVAYILRTNMSVAGVALMEDLGLTQVQFGMVLAAFAWGYGLFQFPGGVLGGRMGARRALALIMVLWGVVNLLTGLVPATSVTVVLGGLILLRFVMGAVQAPLFPVMTGNAIAAWFPANGWALPNGLTSTGLTLGAAAAGPLIAWLAGEFGWRQSFVLTSPLAFGAAAWWWWYARDRPEDHAAVSAAEIELIEADRPELQPEVRGAWLAVLRDRNVLLLTASYFCMNYVFYIFFNWFFVYLVEVRGFTALEGGIVAMAPWFAGAAGATAGGLWCDRLSCRRGIRYGCRVPCIVSLVAVAVLLFGGATATSPWTAVLFLSLCFGATQLTEGAHWAATISVAGRYGAAACGLLNTGGNIVGGFGALLVPITAEYFGWVAALSTGSVFALLGAALWLLIRPDERMQVG